MLAISTSWNHNSETNFKDWLHEAKDIGFDSIELGYELTRNQIEDIKYLKDGLNIKVCSVHNFCPIPNDMDSDRHDSNFYRLSSLDNYERKKAVEWTKNTINTAVIFGASTVVIHAGTVELENDPSVKMLELFKKGHKQKSEFEELRKEFLIIREKNKLPYINSVGESLKEIIPFAKERNIKIGLETRYYPIEIPNYSEIDYFLKIFQSNNFGYWHDVGHAEINSRLGITKQKDFLDSYKYRLIGMHIHGMENARDHLAPFYGDMDLNTVIPYFNDLMLLVIEARYAKADQLRDAIRKLNFKRK